MIHPTKSPVSNLKGNATILHNYRRYLTEFQRITQKAEPVPLAVYTLIKDIKVQTNTPQILREMKLIEVFESDSKKGKLYQWIRPGVIDDKLVQTVYNKVMEDSRKRASERRLRFKDANYVMKRKGMDPEAKVSMPEPESVRIKRKYNKRQPAEQAIVESAIQPVPRPTDKPRIKYSGVLFAPKQLAMIGEKKLDVMSTVLVDKVYSFEGVTKLFFEHSDNVLTVTFLKEYKVTVAAAMGLTPEKIEERVDVIGSIILKNKTIAMSPRFSDGKQGSFAIETIDL